VDSTVPDGTQAELAANQFNSPPKPGRQFFLVYITATYTGPGSVKGFTLFTSAGLNAVGASNVSASADQGDCGVDPDPDLLDTYFSSDIFTGGTIQGWTCFDVLSTDGTSLEMYNDPSGGGNRYWFALH
jgi:hypothetical protein